MDKQIAYSTLEIKAMDESGGKRTFKGVATTPTPDRMGDVVEPKGAEFKLPIPLLWQHDSAQPIGWVRSAKVTNSGIEVECELAQVPEDGALKARLDEAWQSVKAKLVAGLSIGFKPTEYSRIDEGYCYRYIKWLWLELSCVTVAANGDCSITALKSADQAVRRSLKGHTGAQPRSRPDAAGKSGSPPDAPGTKQARTQRVFFIPE